MARRQCSIFEKPGCNFAGSSTNAGVRRLRCRCWHARVFSRAFTHPCIAAAYGHIRRRWQTTMLTLAFFASSLVLGAVLAYHRCAARAWIAIFVFLLSLAWWACGWSMPLAMASALLAAIAAVSYPGPLRRRLISRPLLQRFRRALPQISATEREALDAGTVWWDGELLSGDPDWRRLRALPSPRLNAEEQAFLDDEKSFKG